MIQQLKAELAGARKEIANLRQQIVQLQGQSTQNSTQSNLTSHLKEPNSLSLNDFPALSSQSPP
jgi:phage shock protein A